MRKFYQKIAYTVMITAFTWVVIGDLVNMHMKLIYKKDLYAHSVVFVKTVKKDKANKNIITPQLSGVTNTDNFKFYPQLTFSLISIDKINNIAFEYIDISNLRGPPSVI